MKEIILFSLFSLFNGFINNGLYNRFYFRINKEQTNSSGLLVRKYPISIPHYILNKNNISEIRKYPISKPHYLQNKNYINYNNNYKNDNDDFLENFLKQNNLTEYDDDFGNDNFLDNFLKKNNFTENDDDFENKLPELLGFPSDIPRVRIFYNKNPELSLNSNNNKNKKSEHFEVIHNFPLKFDDIGGFEKIKDELNQCVDFLSNHTKYQDYNVRCPKGLILEGPPGNGKTLLSKAFAGEANVGFIAVSGSEFQDKYVGVGSSRIRELFNLAHKNIPCIVFIDEIDALGRKRSNDGETSSNERDSTLNELLVALDGFKNNTGIFVIGATNRVDLLDPALIRPGRIDKKIYIGPPDSTTREAIINIHIKGKPHDKSINIDDLVELTVGLSGAQIENLLNEAMLNALRYNHKEMTSDDIELILNKMIAGWQPTEHQFTSDMIDQIALHEMGHAIMGLVSKHHSKMTKVVINLSSPKSPAYTVFEGSTSTLYTREGLFEHLSILLAGRIAEEIFYGLSITTGALNDFEEALKLAEKMIIYYGMGKHNIIYPSLSDKYKELIDNEVVDLINDANAYAISILKDCKELMVEGAEILKRDKLLKAEQLIEIINNKYSNLLDIAYLN